MRQMLVPLLVAVALAQRPFRRIHSSPDTFLDLAMSNADEGYALQINFPPEGVPFSLSKIMRTADGGRNWFLTPRDPESVLAFSTGIATQSAASAVTTGPVMLGGLAMQGTQFTNTAVFFRNSQFPEFYTVGLSLSVENVGGVRNAYATAGRFTAPFNGDPLMFNAVLLSTNGGETWTQSRIPVHVGDDSVAGGSFPSNQVWYTIGRSLEDDELRPTGRSFIQKAMKGVPLSEAHLKSGLIAQFDKLFAQSNISFSTESFLPSGSVYKTVNGGLSWSRVWAIDGWRPNKIDCPTINQCYVIGEGARIFVTSDGGMNWRQSYNGNDPVDTIYDISCAAPNECYASGGKFLDFAGYYLHTSNSGASWTRLSASQGDYPVSLSYRFNGAIATCVATTYNLFGEGSGVWISP